MATMLNVYNLNRQKTAVLQNAFQITETKELNKIYSLSFQLPVTDEKAQYIQAYHYVRYGEDGELYRIISVKKNESDTSTLSVTCEHVIATLVDDLMFGTVQYGGGSIKTAAVIRYLLGKQKTANWQLDVCDFDRRFEYLWEQENILNALYSIPREFTKAYRWSFDTVQYPWKLSLKAIDETVNPEYYIRAKSNLLGSEDEQDFTGICTRIYPLGYGEGVNQLGIKEINGGLPYLQAPADVIARYGVKEKVLVDRRYENAESLKAYGQTMLDALSVPSMSRSISVVDLYPLTGAEIDNAQPGQICKLTGDGTITYITKTIRVLDDPGNLQINLSTKSNNVADTIADLADRVRIETVYAQGATQLYQHSKDANATPTKGMVMSLYFPSEMRQINKVLLRLKLLRFRSYSQTTESNGGYNQTLSVQDSSKDITSQTNEGTESVTVAEKSASITTQTNEGTETVNVTVPETFSTTSMTADTNQNLTTTSEGGGVGETSTDGGGTIDVTFSGDAYNTEDVNWTSDVAPYTNNTELDVSVSAQDSSHSHGLSGRVSEVTPLESYDYKHTHYFDEGGTPVGTTTYSGAHSHAASIVNPDGEDGHHHTIVKRSLRHYHYVNISYSSNVQGQTGFAHSHKFHIGDHQHAINIAHQHKVTIPQQTVSVPCPRHRHSVTVPGQTLKVPCPRHKHQITIPGWSKTIDIPPHDHGIKAGIFESGNATAFDIYVGNVKKATVNATYYDGDIATWLLNSQNKVPRDQWIDVTIVPNDLAYVVSSVFVQGFVQSRGGENY